MGVQIKKKYRQYVNGRQTPEQRRKKYQMVKEAGFNYRLRNRLRDWTLSHVKQFIEANRRFT